MLLGLALMLLPQFIGAAAGIGVQQRELNRSLRNARAAATQAAAAAHLQASVEVAEDLARRAPRNGGGAIAARAQAALARARADLTALDAVRGSNGVEREFASVEPLVARLSTPGADGSRHTGIARVSVRS